MAVPDAALLRERLDETLPASGTRLERESGRAGARLSPSVDAVLGPGLRFGARGGGGGRLHRGALAVAGRARGRAIVRDALTGEPIP